jgi:hypothetical protein
MRNHFDTPDCIIHDTYINEEFENSSSHISFTSSKEIDEWDHKWEPKKAKDRRGRIKNYGYVTYKLLRGHESDSFKDSDFEHKALSIALRTWGLRTKDIRFKRVYKADEEADLEVKFEKREDNEYFKERKTVLAYAYFPNGKKIGGDMVFNDDVLWSKDGKPRNAHEVKPDTYPDPNTTTKLKTYNLVHVMIHEGGHALGLRHHPTCRECVMFPYYSGKVILHEHDVERIQSFYGVRKLSQRIIDYFRRRNVRKWN